MTRSRLRGVIGACGILTTGLALLAALLLILEVLLVSAAVLQRELSLVMLTGTTEYVDVLLAALAFSSLAYAQRTGAHVKVDFVLARVRRPASTLLATLGSLCAILMLIWLSYATLRSGLDARAIGEVRYGLLALPVWPVKLLIPVALAAWALELIAITLRNFFDDEEPGEASAPVVDGARP